MISDPEFLFVGSTLGWLATVFFIINVVSMPVNEDEEDDEEYDNVRLLWFTLLGFFLSVGRIIAGLPLLIIF